MSGTPHTFTKDGAQRIVQATEWTEGQRQTGPARRGKYPRPQPGGGTVFEFVVARDREFESTAKTVQVTPVVKQDEAWEFQRNSDGSAIVKRIWTHPRYEARHYAGFAQPIVGSSDTIGPNTQILKAFKVGGAWHLEQTVKWNMPFQEDRFAVEGYLPRRQ